MPGRWRRAEQRSPMVTRSVPPPERVPMIEAPPPTSEPSPTTTPGVIRPSTIERAEGAGVEVDEALVHDGGALGQVRAEPHPVGVARCGRRRARRSRPSAGTCRRRAPAPAPRRPQRAAAGQLEAVDRARARRRSTRRWCSTPKMPSRLTVVRGDEPVREQVQAQVGVGRVGRRHVEVDGDEAHAPGVPAAVSSAPTSASSPGGASSSPAPPGSPSAGAGYQTSRTDPESWTVTRPWPQALRVMDASLRATSRTARSASAPSLGWFAWSPGPSLST